MTALRSWAGRFEPAGAGAVVLTRRCSSRGAEPAGARAVVLNPPVLAPWRRTLVRGCALVAGSLVVVACGHSAAVDHVATPGVASPSTATTPRALLRRSRVVVDATQAVHFTLSAKGLTGSSVTLTGGSGDLVRPDQLTGSLTVSSDGLGASVGVVELDGRFYAEPPFASHYTQTSPANYGFGDPADLLNPTTGVSALLTSMTGVRDDGDRRLSGELVRVISGTIPGREVPVLPDRNRSEPVTLTASIDPATAQLRQVVLAGPFTSATATTTYVVTLTHYGEHVDVTAPRT